jgi:hypothetical protein
MRNPWVELHCFFTIMLSLPQSADLTGKSSVASICVVFHQAVVQAGGEVTGKVCLSVIQDQVSCGSIGCRVTGQETTLATYTTTDSDGNSSSSTATERRRFMDLKLCLRNVPEGVIRRGQYEYPFCFTMPASVPATTYASCPSHFCCVNYTMKVWLDRPGLLRWDIRNTQAFTVVAPTVEVIAGSPVYIPAQSFQLRSLRIFDRGNVLFSGQAASNVVYAGETTAFKFALVNHSQVRIKAIEVGLTERATFSAQGHPGGVKNRLFRIRMTPEEAGLHMSLPQTAEATLLKAMQQLGEAVLSEDSTPRIPLCTVRIPVPHNAVSSYYGGGLVHIQHELSVKLVTTFGTCNPKFKQVIQLRNPAPVCIPADLLRIDKCGEVLHLPNNWAPHIALMVVFPVIPVDMDALRRRPVKEDKRREALYTSEASEIPTAAAVECPGDAPSVGYVPVGFGKGEEIGAALGTSAGLTLSATTATVQLPHAVRQASYAGAER